jgi:transposase-like protein
MYWYRALDSAGNTLEFVRSPHRPAAVAASFFRKALGNAHTVRPRVSNVDKNAAYPPAIAVLQVEGTLAPEGQLRPVKYLNNQIEQDPLHGPPSCIPATYRL